MKTGDALRPCRAEPSENEQNHLRMKGKLWLLNNGVTLRASGEVDKGMGVMNVHNLGKAGSRW